MVQYKWTLIKFLDLLIMTIGFLWFLMQITKKSHWSCKPVETETLDFSSSPICHWQRENESV